MMNNGNGNGRGDGYGDGNGDGYGHGDWHVVRVPGKLMLCGEYAVLSPGGVALALPFGPGVVVGARRADCWRLELPDVGVAVERKGWQLIAPMRPRALRFLWWSLCELQQAVGPELPPLAVTVRADRSDSFPALGISAGTVVGTIMAAARAAGIRLSVRERGELALAAHRNAQGGGSGYDVATLTLNAPTLCRVDDNGNLGWRRARLSPELHLVAGHSGRNAPTERGLERFYAARGAGFERAVGKHLQSSEELALALCGRSGLSLPAATEAADSSLRRLNREAKLGLFPRPVAKLLALARRIGTPARIAGGGGGDAVVGLAASASEAQALAELWQANGFAALALAPLAAPPSR